MITTKAQALAHGTAVAMRDDTLADMTAAYRRLDERTEALKRALASVEASKASLGRKIARHSITEVAGGASVLELHHRKAKDAHCLACGFKMLGGADVGFCPKCGSYRWYRTRLTTNKPVEVVA